MDQKLYNSYVKILKNELQGADGKAYQSMIKICDAVIRALWC